MSQVKTQSSADYRHSGHVAWRRVGQEAVILDVDTAVYYTLKDAGLRIWELLEKKASSDSIVAALCEEFDVEPARAAADFKRLTRQLEKERLIERA